MVHLVISSPSPREALHHHVRFRPPLIDTPKVRLDRPDSTAVLAFDFGYDASRQVASYVSMATPRVLRAAVGPSLRLHHVRFRHDEERGERRMQKSPEGPQPVPSRLSRDFSTSDRGKERSRASTIDGTGLAPMENPLPTSRDLQPAIEALAVPMKQSQLIVNASWECRGGGAICFRGRAAMESRLARPSDEPCPPRASHGTTTASQRSPLWG
jgi:hypothetical protein